MNLLKKFCIIFFYILIISCFNSCRTLKDPCPDVPAIGNMGPILNTAFDDYMPFVYNDSLFYKSVLDKKTKEEQIFKSVIINNNFQEPEIYNKLSENKLLDIGSSVFYYNSKKNITELFYTAAESQNRKLNSDIYYSSSTADGWEKPVKLSNGISSEYYESNPAISPDGNFIIFCSDRPGGFGETDLYISKKLEDGSWAEPVNMGNSINTSKMDVSPFISADNSLWYSSLGFSEKSKLDIIKASSIGEGQWGKPKLLPFPINTDADDTSPALWNGKLIFSSNRKGGCGGFDIYSFDICGPVILETVVNANNKSLPLSGKILLFDHDEKLIEEKEVNGNGIGAMNLTAGNDYILKYQNNCIGDNEYKYYVTAPCSDTSVIKLILNIDLKDKEDFSFAQYKVPFFVTGYYYPNTTENLTALRLKFAYNLIGTSDSTMYIENPGEKYDLIAPIIDKAVMEASDFILGKINFLKNSCTETNERIKITIEGYTDPRAVAVTSKYAGEVIDDNLSDMRINPGEYLTNELLSKLRAYYTAKLLIQILSKTDEYTDYSDKIDWVIEGKGVDLSENINQELMRRVDIKIEVINN